ncbi:MAG: glycosyltransferase family 2 protein [Candidatus Bathyarchaeia archaeon]
MNGNKIIAILPAFNEQRTIAEVILKAEKYVDEVVVVDDGSSDLTAEIAERLGATVIRHKRNMGYGAALRSGFEYALKLNPKVVVTLDADGQHDPNDIQKLIKPILSEEADIVIGSRFLHKIKKHEIPAYREVGIKALTKLTKMSSKLRITDAQSGFRAYSRKAMETITIVEDGMDASTEILLKAAKEGLKIAEIPISIKYKGLKPFKHNPVLHAMDVAIGILKFMSIRRPLLFFGLPGFAIVVFGLAYGYFLIQAYAMQAKPITNIALLSMAIVSLGILLIFMALILFAITAVIKEKKL